MESVWLSSVDPGFMLDVLLGPSADQRKLRLFGVACLRRVDGLFRLPESAAAVELYDRHIDGLVRAPELAAAGERVQEAYHFSGASPSAADWAVCALFRTGGGIAREVIPFAALHTAEDAAGVMAGSPRDLAEQADLVREIFGNPFRRVAFDSAWRTETAVLLARRMYASRDFDAMPILADALQDAGCDNDDVLTHCRKESGHVRGCWVVDEVLGK